jgi:ABC-type nitrate/sulfonate/bicarbonate transport system substrate-binding protein
LGVSKIGSLTDQITRIVLEKAGIDPDKVTYQQAGSSPDRLAALQAGAFDGTVLDSPAYLQAQQAGMNTLINLATELEGFPFEVLYAKKDVIDANHDKFVRFMRGYIKAAQYATDPANKDEVIQIVSEATGIKADAVKLAYEETIKDFPPTGAFAIDGIKLALDGTKQYADIPGIEDVSADDLYYPDLQKEAASQLGVH